MIGTVKRWKQDDRNNLRKEKDESVAMLTEENDAS